MGRALDLVSNRFRSWQRLPAADDVGGFARNTSLQSFVD
jgi:hypothetical protein